MQPYFLPYIGYFQLIGSVDVFVIYDNIKYTKKGWINRNRYLQNGSDAIFSLPLKKDSDFLNVVERQLAEEFDRTKLLKQFKGAYGRAPYFEQTLPLLERIVGFEDNNLFRYIHHSLVETCKYLGIRTDIRISSAIDVDHGLKGQERVLALCQAMGAETYINAIGGLELYEREDFNKQSIELKFIKSKPEEYPQFAPPFVPWLSIVDVLVFNPLEFVMQMIGEGYEFV